MLLLLPEVLMGRTPRYLVLCAVFVLTLNGGLDARAAGEPPPGIPTATSSPGVATVGPLFSSGLDQPHTCTAGVLDSPHGNLLITAAHCLVGSGAGLLFAPGYEQGRTPAGVWTVQRAWTLPGWLDHQDPHSDVTILQVADHLLGGQPISVQSVTGGLPLGQTAAPGTPPIVTTVAYPAGLNDLPVTCTARLASTLGYPTFNCHGYPGGTSGSPFTWSNHGHPPVVIGVIGGPHQGGCYEWNSFSSTFDQSLYRLLARAINNLPADLLPPAGPDDC